MQAMQKRKKESRKGAKNRAITIKPSNSRKSSSRPIRRRNQSLNHPSQSPSLKPQAQPKSKVVSPAQPRATTS